MANVNPSPKQRVLASPVFVSEHKALVDLLAFDRGCDFALLEYQRRLSESVATYNDAAANHFKMSGAMEFLAVFRNLAETTTVPTRQDKDNLSHAN